MTSTLSPFSTLSSFIEGTTENPIKEFLTMVADPCLDQKVDCGEIKSPCCAQDLKTVFGTLPLEVECEKCGLHHFLRDLVQKELTTV